jgi:hypothetical protein
MHLTNLYYQLPGNVEEWKQHMGAQLVYHGGMVTQMPHGLRFEKNGLIADFMFGPGTVGVDLHISCSITGVFVAVGAIGLILGLIPTAIVAVLWILAYEDVKKAVAVATVQPSQQ